jgi:FkbM family methyltransferase
MSCFLKKILCNLLGLNYYLSFIQKSYLLAYRTGWLKKKKAYAWHYFVENLIQKNDTVVDIGANLGYFSYVFARCLDGTGHLYCIEPVAPYCRQLRKIIKGKNNVSLLAFALGNENKASVTLSMPIAFEQLGYLRHGTVSINTEKEYKGKFIFESPLRKADEVFNSLPNVDYIKCDIEGYERIVLPELRALLQQHQPFVQLETWGSQLKMMQDFFDELGFEGYQLQQGELVHCNQQSYDLLGSSDILFVGPARKEQIMKWIKKN